jgi:hypothetical protein
VEPPETAGNPARGARAGPPPNPYISPPRARSAKRKVARASWAPKAKSTKRADSPGRYWAVSTFVENAILISARQMILVAPSCGWRGDPQQHAPGSVRKGPEGPEAPWGGWAGWA